MLTAIEDDRLSQGPQARTVLVLLGDYIDRGPQSREVLDTVLTLQAGGDMEVRALKGNHEHQMLLFLDNAEAGPMWGNFGGLDTLLSYGVRPPPPQSPKETWEDARLALVSALPASHLALLQSLETTAECGDYLFVHAGVRPGIAIADNTEIDLLTIRDDFLSSRKAFGKVVVHGHTPQPEPYLGANRIGIDTGAYATGRLTAVRLLGPEQHILQVEV